MNLRVKFICPGEYNEDSKQRTFLKIEQIRIESIPIMYCYYCGCLKECNNYFWDPVISKLTLKPFFPKELLNWEVLYSQEGLTIE